MSKYYGKIGYVETVETAPDVYEEVITERNYYGDVVRNTIKWNPAQQVNDNVGLSTQFSVLADSYAYEHFKYIRYVTYMGVKWEVTSVDPSNRPRLLISVGDVYNGPEEEG